MTDGAVPRAPLRVTVFDYGAGNLHSLVKAIEAGGAAVHVETDPVLAVRDRPPAFAGGYIPDMEM